MPLGIYGGERNRKEAEREARTMGRNLTTAHAGKRVLDRLGLTPPGKKAVAPTLGEWWDSYLRDYTPAKAANTQAHDRFAKSVVYAPMRVGAIGRTFGEMGLDEIKPLHCLAALRLRRKMSAGNPGAKSPRPSRKARCSGTGGCSRPSSSARLRASASPATRGRASTPRPTVSGVIAFSARPTKRS